MTGTLEQLPVTFSLKDCDIDFPPKSAALRANYVFIKNLHENVNIT